MSSLTLIFDSQQPLEKQSLLAYSEILVFNNNNKFAIDFYIDGVFSKTENTDIDFLDNATVLSQLSQLKEMSSELETFFGAPK